ncbi:MAG TPA: hypothetical protein VL485_04755 [Ktedonobacteraceae bacterium]|jgi:hypothetical protein|nr:hypothetical protein [Ktedonobacteraceae bacterium]
MSDDMYTPWGIVRVKQQLAEDVFLVQTPDEQHGGILISTTRAEEILSDKARTIGQIWQEFLAFEQESAMMVVFYEHPELYPWVEEDLTARFAEESVREGYPGYFIA